MEILIPFFLNRDIYPIKSASNFKIVMKKCKTRWWNFINVNLYNSLFFFNTATIKQFIKKSIESIRIPISKFSSSKKFLSRIKKHKRENSFSSIVTFLPFSLLIEKGLARWWRSRPSSFENTTPPPSCRQHDVVPYVKSCSRCRFRKGNKGRFC